MDPNELLPLILECAAEKYKTCSIKEADHLTITLKALFQAHSNDTTLDRELFERTVKQVILQPDASVDVYKRQTLGCNQQDPRRASERLVNCKPARTVPKVAGGRVANTAHHIN